MASTTYPCEHCKFRASYDKNPQSAALRAKYNFQKYQ